MTSLKSRLGLGLTLLVATCGLAGCVTYAPATPGTPTTTTESTTTTAPAMTPPPVMAQPNSTTTTTTQTVPAY